VAKVSERIKVVRVHTSTAYARNGNHHNPTKYYHWDTYIDGVNQGRSRLKREAVKFGEDILAGVYDD
jgi:hypothetical protein